MDQQELLDWLRSIEATVTQDGEGLEEIEEKINDFKEDPTNIEPALQLLAEYNSPVIIFFAKSVLYHLFTLYWVPHSMNPDPSQSIIAEESKIQIREFFAAYIESTYNSLSEASQSFIISLIKQTMKIDIENEGVYWLNKAVEHATERSNCCPYLKVVRYLAEDFMSYFDHSTSSQVRASSKQAFIESLPELCNIVLTIFADEEDPDVVIECFKLVDTMVVLSSATFAQQIPEMVEICIAFSSSSIPMDVSIEALKTMHDIFWRVNFVALFDVEDRQEILAAAFEFFEEEMSQMDPETTDIQYISSLLVAYQPLAANHMFRSNLFEDDAIDAYLTMFEEWTWDLFGSVCFRSMIDMWTDFYHGMSNSPATAKFGGHFIQMIDHIMQMLTDETMIPTFVEDDYIVLNEFINACMVTYSDDICLLVQTATQTAINNHLFSVDFLLRLFLHTVTYVEDDSEFNIKISDNFLRYMNELMHRYDEEGEVFLLTKNILQQFVRRFTRLSRHFLELVLHLVFISLDVRPQFTTPMLELLLETLKVERPEDTARKVLFRLQEKHDEFLELSTEDYALYLCCCITVAAFPPSDSGTTPLAASPEYIQSMFAITFENLNVPEETVNALKIMKMAVQCVMLCQQCSKNLVFQAFVPQLEIVLSMYEAGVPESVIQPLFEFLFVFCSVFPKQIGEEMNEIISRLFGPLRSAMDSLEGDSIEQTAACSFTKLLLQIAQHRSQITQSQSDGIIEFILSCSDSLVTGHAEIITNTIGIIGAILEDRWAMTAPGVRIQLLQILMFNGMRTEYPDALKAAVDALVKIHDRHHVLHIVDPEFLYEAFSAICTEMCRCTQTALREHLIRFVVYMGNNAPNFMDNLLYPYIRALPVVEEDQVALAGLFANTTDEREFKVAFVNFCDDVAYLMMGNEDAL